MLLAGGLQQGSGGGSLRLTLLLLGVVQSPMVPGREILKSIWCPPGPERALSLHVVFFGNNLKMVAAPVAFSWLCAARGWRAACLGMSGMGVLMGAIWQTCAANGPSDWRWGMTAAKSTLLASAEAMMMVSGAGTFIDTPAPCCPHGASTVELWYKCNALSF